MKKIVITGGTHSGKTTLIELLEKKGYFVVHEAAIEIIKSLNTLIGINEQKRWRAEYIFAFQDLVWKKIMNLESTCPPNMDYVFLDRGIFDGLAYIGPIDSVKEGYFRKNFAQHTHYDAAFVLDTLTNFDKRLNTGRTSNYEQSCNIGNKLYEIYTNERIRTHKVPVLPIEERCDLILRNLPI